MDEFYFIIVRCRVTWVVFIFCLRPRLSGSNFLATNICNLNRHSIDILFLDLILVYFSFGVGVLFWDVFLKLRGKASFIKQ